MKAKIGALLTAMLLSGCGGNFEWFPASNQASASVEQIDAGGYLGAQRSEPGPFTTRTAKGLFYTYTSLAVPLCDQVTLERHIDPDTHQTVSQLLRSGSETALVKTVLTLAR